MGNGLPSSFRRGPSFIQCVFDNKKFNAITQKDTKPLCVQDAGTTGGNSEYQDMTAEELEYVRKTAKQIL